MFQWLALGRGEVFVQIMEAVFDMAKLGFQVSLGLAGVMAFWMGMMRIGEKSGALQVLERFIAPLFARLFPGVPTGHPANGAMLMNLSANVLGLDNAATPLGLKAMKELQSLNPDKETASDDQIMFLVINTSSVTLFPIAVFTYRAQQGAADPTDVFIPILIATFISTLAGICAAAFYQKVKLNDPAVLLYLGGAFGVVAGTAGYFSALNQSAMQAQSALISNFLLFLIIIAFMGMAHKKGVDVFAAFIEGAKEAFQVVLTVFPYLVAMLAGVGAFRACGALDFILQGGRWLVEGVGADSRFVEAIPTALMKPLSGSGARGLMVETMSIHGADSFAGRLSCIFQGSTETTFYVLALYFGSVQIRRTRHALACGLFADFAGIAAAILTAYWFFG